MSLPSRIEQPPIRTPDCLENAATTPAGGVDSKPPQSVVGRSAVPETVARRPAWKGLVRICFFFALTFVLALGLDALFNAGLRSLRTGQFGVTNQMVQGKINADIIITGSSRALSHYDPRILQAVTGLAAFNLGRNGSQTDMQLAVLKTYLKHNRKPRIVLHNLDAFSFVMTREVYDPAQYMPYLGERDIYVALHQINPEVWWKCKHLPLYGYAVEDMRLDWMMGPLGLLGWSPRQNFWQGFNPRVGKWTEDFASFKAANPDGVRFGIEPVGIQVMADLAQLCRENGIRLIFVYSPEYREMQFLTKDRAAIFDEFRKLAREYEVPLWDFSSWEQADSIKYFMNSQHLNADGAAIFSADLAHRLAEELAPLNRKALAKTPASDQPSRQVVNNFPWLAR